MAGKGNEMAFQLEVQMWQYWLCDINVSGADEVDVLRRTNAMCDTGLIYCNFGRKKKNRLINVS